MRARNQTVPVQQSTPPAAESTRRHSARRTAANKVPARQTPRNAQALRQTSLRLYHQLLHTHLVSHDRPAAAATAATRQPE